MPNDPRLSVQSLKVLATLLDAGGEELSGASIGKLASLQSGTLYPILMRFEECGWVSSQWETDDPKILGRPRRRFYTLTGVGATRARAHLNNLQPGGGTAAWGQVAER